MLCEAVLQWGAGLQGHSTDQGTIVVPLSAQGSRESNTVAHEVCVVLHRGALSRGDCLIA